MIRGRARVHLSTFVVTVLLGVALAYLFPDLRKDAPAIFSTISGFLTLYGVLFAILEVRRLETVTRLVATKAAEAADRVETVYRVRELEECNTAIKLALGILDKQERVPSAMLHEIQDRYSRHFRRAMCDSNSVHLARVSVIQSYGLQPASAPVNGRRKLTGTLLQMGFDLAIAADTKASEVKK